MKIASSVTGPRVPPSYSDGVLRRQAVRAALLLLVLPIVPLLAACANRNAASEPPSALAEATVLPGEEWLVYQTGGPESVLRLVRPDGSDDHFLVRDAVPGDEAHPTWSPDGSRIAFDVAVDEPNGRTRSSIWVVNADGTGARELASCSLPCLQLAYPAWSPDGTQIAISRYDTRPDQSWGPSAAELLDVATGGRRVVWASADGTSSIAEVDWSPDGSSLVTTLETYPDEQQATVTSRSVIVLPADTTTAEPSIISSPGEFASEPDWGPDGRIAYASLTSADRLQPTELVIVNADGSDQQRITTTADGNLLVFEPEWTSDGTALRVSTDDGTIARMGLANVAVDDDSIREESWRLRTSPWGPWATHVHARPIP